MKAADIMTRTVVSVGPNDTVKQAAGIMARHHVSALPVIDDKGKLVGVVSEGDLIHRAEIKTEKKRSWWLDLVSGGEVLAKDYVKSFGGKVRDVMTPQVVSVGEAAPLSEIAELLEGKRIKRVPVVRGGKVIGIVSRANLVQALATLPRLLVPETVPDDARLRDAILGELGKQKWGSPNALNVTVHNGVVHVWGTVFSAAERQATRIAIERVPGVRSVQDHLSYYVPPAVLV